MRGKSRTRRRAWRSHEPARSSGVRPFVFKSQATRPQIHPSYTQILARSLSLPPSLPPLSPSLSVYKPTHSATAAKRSKSQGRICIAAGARSRRTEANERERERSNTRPEHTARECSHTMHSFCSIAWLSHPCAPFAARPRCRFRSSYRRSPPSVSKTERRRFWSLLLVSVNGPPSGFLVSIPVAFSGFGTGPWWLRGVSSAWQKKCSKRTCFHLLPQ